MEIDHFSHEHRLILIEEDGNFYNNGDDIRRSRHCNGCLDPIFPPPGGYYSCADDCEFYLHEYCAELPREIQHPLHQQHILKLFAEKERRCVCDCCHRESQNFTYTCFECDFDLDVICAVLMDRQFQHNSHRHPFHRLRKPGLLNCDACNAEHRGIFYHCYTCRSFFIHQDCFYLPNTISQENHSHPLVLQYSLPSQYSAFIYFCEICTTEVDPAYWMYCCLRCRLFLHVNCATSKNEPYLSNEPFMSILLPAQSPVDTIEEDKAPSNGNLIYFPVEDQSITVINYILQGVSITYDESDITTATAAYQDLLDHFSHEHPLIVDMQDSSSSSSDTLCLMMNDTRVNEKICNACVKPISPATPFYKCSLQCNDFFLHKCCADLPVRIDEHPYHIEDHPLILLPNSPTSFKLFKCQGCDMYCNGFTYKCSECDDFNLDVHCGSLPFTIKHQAHNHILSLRNNIIKRCNSCYDNWDKPIIAYGCNTCKNFELDSRCALSARKVRHRYDEKHPFILTYFPVEGQSIYDYYCELCEEEIHPLIWCYHCADCDKYVHIKCLRPFYRWSNLKFGGIFEIESHPHRLALAPVVEDDTKFIDSLQVIIQDTKCNKCDTLFQNSPQKCPLNPFGFRCDEYNYTLCYECAKSCNKDLQ